MKKKLLWTLGYLFIILFSTSLHAEWNVDASGTSASTSPSPYLNNDDSTAVLSISGAAKLDVTISGETESRYDFVYITDADGNTRRFDGSISETYTVEGSSITIRFTSDGSVTRDGVTVSIEDHPVTRWIKSDDNTSAYTDPSPYLDNTDITETLSIPGALSLTVTVSGTTERSYDFLYVTDADGNTRRFDGSISETYTVQGSSITIQFTSDRSATSDGVQVSISSPPPQANDDEFSTDKDTTLQANVLGNDTGGAITVTDNTIPSNGTLVIGSDGNFTYTPNTSFVGYDSFSYTITDNSGQTDTATVSIAVGIDFTTGVSLPFSLVNPPETRNIIGNYAIAGNTVLCLTEKTTGYGGTCQGDNSNYLDITSNMRVSKYIDIDSHSGTWNSSSSYVNIPSTYDSAQNIVWAGLFWQGRVAWDTNYPIHYEQPNGEYDYTPVEVGAGTAGTPVDVIQAGATKIKLKIDNGNYNDVNAIKFHTYNSSNGETYAAYADVTSILRAASLGVGKHVFTVANLLTMEGREPSPGAYGGWSLVLIYSENFLTSRPRNISIYNGFISIGTNDNPIEISGFKLPKSGPVQAQLSVFSGEGEYRYGRTPSNSRSDWLKISNESSANYIYPPGCSSGTDLGNCNNIFDAHLTGILRDNIPGESNDQSINNVGIDIDSFNVSSIMEGYRNNNPDINKTYLKTFSDNDYITPSMIAFSAELYKPSVCYDYTIQKDKFDITTDTREIVSIGQGDLSLNFAIQSTEGDFDFESSSLGMRLVPYADTSFVDALYAPDNVNTMVPAIYSVNHTFLHPIIALGEDVTPLGGTIKRLQRYFAKFNYHMDSDHYNGKFEVELNTTVDYGSGAVPIILSTENNTITRCPQSPYYNPIHTTFNVERHGSSGDPDQKYPLYTQVVGKDFDFDVVAYQEDPPPAYSTEIDLDGYTVDVELINVRPYSDANSTFVCNNPDPNIIQTLNSAGDKHVFAKFENNSRVDMSALDIQTDTALRNAAFRIWYIVDENNTLLKHSCTDASDNACFQKLYDDKLKASDDTLQASGTHGFCTEETLGTGGCSSYTNPFLGTSGCYACLRDFFSNAACSRDNFSIRPAAYRMSISDSNESVNPARIILLGTNDQSGEQPVTTLAAGYQYRIEGNATSYVNGSTLANGYTRIFDNLDVPNLHSLLLFKDSDACLDKNATSWNLSFINSRISGIVNGDDVNLSSGNLVRHNNVGHYAFQLYDSNWTIIDQKRYAYKTFPDVDDCIPNDNSISETSRGMSGCNIKSSLNSNTGGGSPTYNDLYLLYQPYAFRVNASPTFTPDNNITDAAGNVIHYLFMNDFFRDENAREYFEDPSINAITMSTQYIGKVSAITKGGIVTTNFTDGGAASDVNLTIQFDDNNSLETYSMQMVLQHKDINQSFDGNTTTSNHNGTLLLPKAAFEDATVGGASNAGKATVILSTTVSKTFKDSNSSDNTIAALVGINPIKITYDWLKAQDNTAWSHAEMKPKHIPEGINDTNATVMYIYGKVTPEKLFYKDVTQDYKQTALYVDMYCDPSSPYYDYAVFSTATFGNDEDNTVWHHAGIFSSSQIGSMELNASHYSEADASPQVAVSGFSPSGTISPVFFNTPSDAKRQDINVSVTGSARPSVVKIKYTPKPWLVYDKDKDFYRVKFIGNGGWNGIGSTGSVSQTKSSTNTKPRMNW